MGSLSRFGISRLVVQLSDSKFPWGTLSANILACAVLASVWLWMGRDFYRYPFWSALAVIGFCGGFSTFSTFSLETLMLLEKQMYLWAVANVLVSVASCLFVLYAFMKWA